MCVSCLLGMFKDARKRFGEEESAYGCVLISTKFCSNFRKTRDVVNGVYYVLQKKKCRKMKSVRGRQYLKKKKLMTEAEVKVMEAYKFDLRGFRVEGFYNLLFSILTILKASDQVIKSSYLYLNESFSAENINLSCYPDIIASCIKLAFISTKCEEPDEILNEEWYKNHFFNSQNVLNYFNLLQQHVNQQS